MEELLEYTGKTFIGVGIGATYELGASYIEEAQDQDYGNRTLMWSGPVGLSIEGAHHFRGGEFDLEVGLGAAAGSLTARKLVDFLES